jgi:putative endonuclease
VFVEVKTRASEEFGRPLEAIAPSQQRRIAQGAIDWLRRLENPGAIPVRFDVVEVVDREGGPEITLIRDAFRTPDDLRLD